MRAEYGANLRAWLLENGLSKIVDFGDLPVFKGVAAYPAIVFLDKSSRKKDIEFTEVSTLEFKSLHDEVEANVFKVPTKKLSSEAWSISNGTSEDIKLKIEKNSKSLNEYIDEKVYRGILTGLSEAFILDEDTCSKIFKIDKKSKDLVFPFVTGKEIKPFIKLAPKKYLICIPKGWTNSMRGKEDAWKWFNKNYPGVANHLLQFKTKAEKRTDKGDYWWEVRACDYYNAFKEPKIVYLVFQVRPAFTFDTSGMMFNNSGFFIPGDDMFLLGYLNSKIGWMSISSKCTKIQGGYQLIYKYFGKIPVPIPKTEREIKIANRIRERVKQLSKGSDSSGAKDIDALFYEYFGFSTKEIVQIESILPDKIEKADKKLKKAA